MGTRGDVLGEQEPGPGSVSSPAGFVGSTGRAVSGSWGCVYNNKALPALEFALIGTAR